MKKSWGKFYSKTVNLKFLIQNTFCHLELFTWVWEEAPKKILEIGVGTGSMSIFFSYLGLDVTGLDNDQDILKKARNLSKKLNGKAKFIHGNAFNLPFKDKSFDVVLSQGLLEHFQDDEIFKLLDEQLRVGKVVILSVPNKYYSVLDFGDERLLTDENWYKLLSKKYHILKNLSYNPHRKTILRGRIVYKVINTMFLAKIVK
ncbi:MAG: class I SAM-dependent methyltransferase [Patescibacteria group bacterium]